MNRVKFRAWDNTGKCMLDWMLLCQSAFNRVKDGEGPAYGMMYRVLTNQANANDNYGYVVMLSIGFSDKNGKEIYQGDIGEIKTQSGRLERFVVKRGVHRREMKSGWTVDIPGFCFEVDGFPTFPIVNNYVNGHDLDIIEIIGNIFENPELLQTNKDKEDARP